MKIEDDGTLSFGLIDLNDPKTTEDRTVLIDKLGLYAFNHDAQIAGSYAFAAGHQVIYAEPGLLATVPQKGCQLVLKQEGITFSIPMTQQQIENLLQKLQNEILDLNIKLKNLQAHKSTLQNLCNHQINKQPPRQYDSQDDEWRYGDNKSICLICEKEL